MFSQKEKEARWTLFEKLPLTSQKHIHNLIMLQGERYRISTVVQQRHLVRVK
jgi:hypothetical protein